jgi:hypothetical protein
MTERLKVRQHGGLSRSASRTYLVNRPQGSGGREVALKERPNGTEALGVGCRYPESWSRTQWVIRPAVHAVCAYTGVRMQGGL